MDAEGEAPSSACPRVSRLAVGRDVREAARERQMQKLNPNFLLFEMADVVSKGGPEGESCWGRRSFPPATQRTLNLRLSQPPQPTGSLEPRWKGFNRGLTAYRLQRALVLHKHDATIVTRWCCCCCFFVYL